MGDKDSMGTYADIMSCVKSLSRYIRNLKATQNIRDETNDSVPYDRFTRLHKNDLLELFKGNKNSLYSDRIVSNQYPAVLPVITVALIRFEKKDPMEGAIYEHVVEYLKLAKKYAQGLYISVKNKKGDVVASEDIDKLVVLKGILQNAAKSYNEDYKFSFRKILKTIPVFKYLFPEAAKAQK